jgi:glyoxylase-like metal-dependent hydrolase (beta-lactamase superfamily II)
LITALYDGFVPVPADDLHGAPPAEIHRLLAEAFLPPEGDQRTAVIAFLVEHNGLQIMIDTGSGGSLGPDTGCLATNLATAQIDPADIDHVLLTHMQPDHAGGLISPDGQPVFPRATVHAAKADADHWLDAAGAACATGVQRLVYETAASVLAPLPQHRPVRDLSRWRRGDPRCAYRRAKRAHPRSHRLPVRRGRQHRAVLGRHRP